MYLSFVFQHDYLLENCLEQIQEIQNAYKDDNVEIRLRQKQINAPRYLMDTIKKKLSELLCYSTTFQFFSIGSVIALTDEQHEQLNQIARKNYCRIEKIDRQTDWIVCSIPKALSFTVPKSNLLIERSNELCSSITMKKMAISRSTIEIYLEDQNVSLLVRQSFSSFQIQRIVLGYSSIHASVLLRIFDFSS